MSDIIPKNSKPSANGQTSRRQFLKTTSILAAASGASASVLGHAATAHPGGDDLLKVGVVGCGGRGSGAILDALQADKNVKLTAIADAFADRIALCLDELSHNEEVEGKVDVPQERQFVGFNAYQELIDSDVDVVILATPPHFRPLHLKAAIDAGKHVFCEKPVAVDAPGIRSVLETSRLAKEKGLSLVSGLCMRYHPGLAEGVQRIHDGAIGDVFTLFANDYRSTIWVKTPKPDWTPMHLQMRNWYYYTWLSGDFNVEQHIHYLDLCSWAKGSYPIKAIGTGGRQVRTEEKYGNIFDHHSVVYEYEDGSRLISNTRQQDDVASKLGCYLQGTKGTAELSSSKALIKGATNWRHRGKVKSMYEIEHDQLFEGIRAGKPVNNGEYMCNSTMLAIMGRMATYTGQEITWEQAMNSQEDLTPAAYEWGPAPEVVIAEPGKTKFV